MSKDKPIQAVREALEAIVYNYPNVDLNHVDFRVKACKISEQALKRIDEIETKLAGMKIDTSGYPEHVEHQAHNAAIKQVQEMMGFEG
ncbi:MAG: hypothetical protein ACUZ8E_17640 [Candidatus Anammoxibacter sp.]